jgi:hypothetical protein
MRGFLAAHWRRVLLTAAGILVVGYLALALAIGHQVARMAAHAQALHPGGPVEALITLAVTESAPLAERNRAIWGLGQLGAHEALPALASLVTGQTCDHGRKVCQREVRKAMQLCSGAPNLGALVWRHGELAAR